MQCSLAKEKKMLFTFVSDGVAVVVVFKYELKKYH